MEIKDCINYLLTTAQHNVNQYLNQKLSAYDITASQYSVLDCLWTSEGACTPKQIADKLCLETSTISGTLDRMQKKELINRIINTEDRREIFVTLTKKGLSLKDPICEIIDQMNVNVLSGLSDEETTKLRTQLKIISERRL